MGLEMTREKRQTAYNYAMYLHVSVFWELCSGVSVGVSMSGALVLFTTLDYRVYICCAWSRWQILSSLGELAEMRRAEQLTACPKPFKWRTYSSPPLLSESPSTNFDCPNMHVPQTFSLERLLDTEHWKPCKNPSHNRKQQMYFLFVSVKLGFSLI